MQHVAPTVPLTSPALVTGCSSGIGRATALRLVRSGRPTYATARRVESLDELAAAGARVLPLDVTDEASRVTAVDRVVEEAGPIGVLVNNAGYGEFGPVEEVPLDAVRAQFETNVLGLLRMMQLVLPGMRSAGAGRIVNVSSMGGRMTLPGGGTYHASKYAVEATSAQESSGPYALFRRGVAQRNARSYRKGARGTITPDDVAEAIVASVRSPRPRPRQVLGGTGRLLVWSHQLLPTRAWDALLRRSFPTPSRADR